ncbi:MAG TPA: hypothetical protein VFW64_12140 [Pseudonocardiaceae bacterium]|nr:hypothetical protein [Pseudonocardiaceae bacterium]
MTDADYTELDAAVRGIAHRGFAQGSATTLTRQMMDYVVAPLLARAEAAEQRLTELGEPTYHWRTGIRDSVGWRRIAASETDLYRRAGWSIERRQVFRGPWQPVPVEEQQG